MVVKVIATVLDVILFLIVGWFGLKITDKTSKIGFGIMEVAYIMSVLGMWL